MNRQRLLALSFAVFALAACDQVRVPGINPTDSSRAQSPDTTDTPPPVIDENEPDTSPTTNNTPIDADEDEETSPTEANIDTLPDVSGTRFIVEGNVYERHALSTPGEWMAIKIGPLAGMDQPDGPYYDGEALRNGLDIAGADRSEFRNGDRYIQDDVIIERRLIDGTVQLAIVGEIPAEPGSPADDIGSDTETTTDAPLPTLAELNAVTCGLPGDIQDTPTVGMVAGATSVEQPQVGTAAVNALASQLVNFPGLVKMEPRNVAESGAISSGHCGATRIAEDWFITAAHCVDESYQEIQLISGSENIRSPIAQTLLASQAICHGGYNGSANGYANDIALIRIDAEQREALANVPIANYGATERTLVPVNYETVDMAGWGITSFGGQLSNELLGATLTLESAGPAVINVSSRAGAGPCIGDSGGPLFVTEADGSRTIVGVLSVVEQNRATGQFCAGDYKGRYTHLQGYRDWISSVIERCDSDEEMCQ